MSITDRIIARAKRTPYFHLKGYMNRWWLVPYVSAGSGSSDGCGLVSWRRPITRLLQHLGIAVRVHEILRSDLGRDPHDHPWPYLTIVLKGGYWEERYDSRGFPTSRKWHGPGSVLFRRAKDLHRLVLPTHLGMHDLLAAGSAPGQICWAETWYEPATTLFITGRYAQKWGFLVSGTKVPHSEYHR
jgi:hypothetical protein